MFDKEELKIWEYKCFCFYTCIDFPKRSNFSLNLCMMSSFVCGYNRLLNKVPFELPGMQMETTVWHNNIVRGFLSAIVAVYKIFL